MTNPIDRLFEPDTTPPEELAHNLLETFPSPVVVFDAETWRPIGFNDHAAAMMGYTRDEFASVSISDLEAVPAPDETKKHVEAIQRVGGETFVREHKCKDGSLIRVLISVRWIRWFGRAAMMTTWHDTAKLPEGKSAPGTPSSAAGESPRETYVWADPRSGRLLSLVDRVAVTDTTVLVTGETGTGKERIARRVHHVSPRAGGPFVAVNCAALPADLIEAELFGHVKGAFSGATAARKGSFEQADKGTLFLDEIGELPLPMQAKLLRALDEPWIQPLGASSPRRVDVRVVAATNRNLAEAASQARFRSDLYHRLNAFPVHIAPLRERRQDIGVLVTHVLRRLEQELARPVGTMGDDDLSSLERYSWPGNVRELQNVLRRAAILSSPNEFKLPDDWCTTYFDEAFDPKSESLDSRMKAHIETILEACNWSIEGSGGAAERLGMAPSTLRYRLNKLGIERPK